MGSIGAVKYAFFAIGLGLLIGAVISANNSRTFIAQADSAYGTVIDVMRRQSNDSDTYAPVVRFVTAAGETVEFTSDTSSNPPGYSTGERVEVLYRPLAPRDAKIRAFGSLWGGPIACAVLGSIFFAVGAGLIMYSVLEARKAADLKRNGRRVLTTLQRVELNENLKVNGRNPYRVFTQWKNPATSETRIFKSSNVWFDPTSYLNGRDITVFVERTDPKRYYVDLSFLPAHRG
jgi:hypothetical protein